MKGVFFIRNIVRIIWGKPNKIDERNLDRRVSYLELFWDVAFATYFATLAVNLSEDINSYRIIDHIFLFSLVWFSWLNGMQYHDIHGNDDIRSRFFAFIHMFCVVGMTVFLDGATGRYVIPFSIFYVILQLIITYEWWYTGVVDTCHLESKPYAIFTGIGGLIFLISIFISSKVRFVFWMLSITATISAPISVLYYDSIKSRRNRLYVLTSSMKARFARLFIIVLAEIITAIVAGLTSHYIIDIGQLRYLFGGLLMAFGIFSLYFDAISFKKLKNNRLCFFLYVFLHLPLMWFISTLGASVRMIVSRYWDSMAIHKVFPSIGISSFSILVICGILYMLFEHKKDEIRVWEDISTFVSACLVLVTIINVHNIITATVIYIICFFLPVFVDFFLNIDFSPENKKN